MATKIANLDSAVLACEMSLRRARERYEQASIARRELMKELGGITVYMTIKRKFDAKETTDLPR